MITAQEGDEERKTVLYARVSTPEQGKNESSKTLQIKAANDYLKQLELSPLSRKDVYVDFGSSSDPDRPALSKLLSDVKRGQIGIILVWHTARLARTVEDFVNFMNIFTSHNVAFYSVQEKIYHPPVMAKVLSHIMEAFSEIEQSVIRDRIRRSSECKRKNRKGR